MALRSGRAPGVAFLNRGECVMCAASCVHPHMAPNCWTRRVYSTAPLLRPFYPLPPRGSAQQESTRSTGCGLLDRVLWCIELLFCCCWVGGNLLSHTLPGAVPSARAGLASGFGMGPGVSPPLSTTDTLMGHTKLGWCGDHWCGVSDTGKWTRSSVLFCVCVTCWCLLLVY